MNFKNVANKVLVNKLRSQLIIALLFVSAGLFLSSHSFFESFNQDWIDQHVRNNGVAGIVIFFAIGVVVSGVGGPRQMVAFLGGYAFGFANGTIISTLSVTLSCFISFMLSRYFARSYVNQRFTHKVARVNHFVTHKPIAKTIVIRLLPVGNNLITNVVGGLTRVKARYFVLGSGIGYIPQMAIFALMGKGVVVQSAWKIALSVLLFLLSTIWSMYLYRQYRAQRKRDKNVPAESPAELT